MTLMPVSNGIIRTSCSWDSGGSRWMGSLRVARTGPFSSTGSPTTLRMRPSTSLPTGTEIGPPVFFTCWPRTRPSVESMAMQRTVFSPRCCATSMVRLSDLSEIPWFETVKAVKISGSDPGGNSTSTTDPITCVTLPNFAVSLSATAIVTSLSLQRLSAGDDLHQLLGDRRLPGAVVLEREPPDHLVCVLGGGVHRRHAGAVLRSLGLEQRAPDRHRQLARNQALEQLRPRRLVEVLGGDEPAFALALRGRGRDDGQQLGEGDGLRHGALELVVEEMDGIELALAELDDQIVGDLFRHRIPQPPEEPDVVLAGLDPAPLREVAPAPSDGGELDRLVFVALFHQEPLRAPDDVRVEAAAEAAVAREQHHFDAAGGFAHLHQRVGRDLRRRPRSRQRAEQLVQRLGIGPGPHHRVLSAAQLGRGNQLHRLGDLLRVPHRLDAVADGAEGSHLCLRGRRPEDAPELLERLVERGTHVVRQILLLAQQLERLRIPRLHEVDQFLHVALDVGYLDVADPDHAALVLLRAGVDLGDLFLDRHRHVLALLEDLGEAGAPRERLPRRLVQVGPELRERRPPTTFRHLQAQGARNLLHALDLRVAADAGYGNAGGDRRGLAGIEEIGLQEDLPVGDGDDVGRDVGGDVACLRLDDRQRRQRAAAALAGKLRGPLEQTAVQIEDVAWIRLAPRRTAQEQRELPVRHCLLGEVVIDDERVLAVVAEVLAHRHAGVGREELQRRGIGGARGDDGGVLHRSVLVEPVHDARDRRLLLADRDVDAEHVLALLVDDRVHRYRRLAGLAVADDQLALSAADGDHRVDGLDARLHRLLHRLARDDAGSLHLDLAPLLASDRTLPVDRLAERVEDATDHFRPDRDVGDAAGALDDVALAQVLLVAHQGDAGRVFLEVEHQPDQLLGKLDQLSRPHPLEPVDARNAVSGGEDGAGLAHLDLLAVALDLLAEDAADFVGPDFRHLLCSVTAR